MRSDTVWQSPELTERFLTGVRGAIPLAAVQIDVMLRVIERMRGESVSNFLDLGCGDGVLGDALLARYPNARGVFADFSEPMLNAARARLGKYPTQSFLEVDYAAPDWLASVEPYAPFDVIVSGFSIHHQPDERKYAVYQEIFDLLSPGGVFLNLEHVASPDKVLEGLFDDLMIDAQYGYFQSEGDTRSRDEIAQTYYYRPDKKANILAPVELQCAWLRDIGYQHVDCYLKIFELALFGGVRG
jgi:tRNA (cmo5U34)-methyltransferase